jgi:hypothetical protein
MLTGSHQLSGSKETRAIYGYAAFSLVLCATCFFLNCRFFHDDSFISLRYALNLADGNGIVWNPGEKVEG